MKVNGTRRIERPAALQPFSTTLLCHVAAAVASALWGTTFVSSKILLNHGLTPADIMLLRFALAYAVLLLFSHRPLFAASVRDELLFVWSGITGGSLYFLAENSALLYTQASNVAIIIATTPLLTILAARFLSRSERITRPLVWGSAVSLAGVVLVVLNGNLVLHFSPAGDLLTLGAAVLWVLYSLGIVRLKDRYPASMITRKVFFYGILTLLPVYAIQPFGGSAALLAQPVVAANLLFLGLVASLFCYWIWNVAVARIGPVAAGNYLYINPVVALVTAWAVLDEVIAPMAVGGTLLILFGVYLAQRHTS